MPQFRITAPDGSVYNVTGPEGSTEQQALAQVQAQHPVTPPAPAAKATAPVAPSRTMEDVARHGTDFDRSMSNAATRMGAQAIGAAPLTAMDLGVAGRNAIGNLINKLRGKPATPNYEMPSAMFDKALNQVTTPPSGMVGKAAEFLGSSALGGMAGPELALSKARMSPEVEALANRGVTMTPGQRGGKVANAIEQRLTSWPIAGESIKNARGKAVEQWNRAHLNEIITDIGGKDIPKTRTAARDALAHVKQELTRRYGEVLGKMRGDLNSAAPQSGSLRTQLEGIKTLAQGLDKSTRRTVTDLIDNQVIGKFTSSGKASGETLKEIQETLRTEADLLRRGSYQDRKASQAIDQARTYLKEMLVRENPKHAAELERVDKGYAKYKTAAMSANSSKKSAGVYTPAQRLSSIARRDKSKDKDLFSTGRAPGQKEAESAEKILGNTVPDSGTPGRLALMEMLIKKPYLLASIPINMLGAAAYSQPVLKMLQKGVDPKTQQALVNLLMSGGAQTENRAAGAP